MGDTGEHATYLVASAPEGEQCRDLSNSWTCPHRRHALGVGQLHRPQHTHQKTHRGQPRARQHILSCELRRQSKRPTTSLA